MDSTSVAARHRLTVPSELMLFFKSIVTVEGMGRSIVDDYDLLSEVMQIANEIVAAKYDPQRIGRDLAFFAKDSAALISGLPAMIKLAFRRFSSPSFAKRFHIEQIDELNRSIVSSSKIIFLGLVIGSLILSASIFAHGSKEGLPILSLLNYVLAFMVGLAAFKKYIKG
jgi:ubiquinone biosynthesis protein